MSFLNLPCLMNLEKDGYVTVKNLSKWIAVSQVDLNNSTKKSRRWWEKSAWYPRSSFSLLTVGSSLSPLFSLSTY